MTCRELIEFLMDYLDGALPDEQRRQFDRHLAVCPSCVAFVKSYERLIELEVESLNEPGAMQLPPLPASLIKSILAAKAEGMRPSC